MWQYVDISDENDPRLDVYLHLTEAQLRAKRETEKGVCIAEAETVIEVALDAGCFPLSMLLDREMVSDRAKTLIGRCIERNPALEVYAADRALLTKMTGFELTRGLLAAFRRPEKKDPAALLANARRIALLENVSDAGNIGAILRSAAGIGFDAVLLTSDCCDPLTRRAMRVSMGTVFLVPWAYLEKGENVQEFFARNGFKTAAMALSDRSISPDDKRLQSEERLAVLLGSEGQGLRKETIENADYIVRIPMRNGVDSLNVAAASAVAFWAMRPKTQ